jgi:hypothetical protein
MREQSRRVERRQELIKRTSTDQRARKRWARKRERERAGIEKQRRWYSDTQREAVNPPPSPLLSLHLLSLPLPPPLSPSSLLKSSTPLTPVEYPLRSGSLNLVD